MKANDLRKQGEEALGKQLQELLRELFNLRMQRGAGQLTRPSEMRAVRRDIARIKTIMSEKRAGGGQ